MNDTSLPKPSQTPTSQSLGAVGGVVPPTSVGQLPKQSAASSVPSMPGFIPATTPMTTPSPMIPNVNSAIPSQPQSQVMVAPTLATSPVFKVSSSLASAPTAPISAQGVAQQLTNSSTTTNPPRFAGSSLGNVQPSPLSGFSSSPGPATVTPPLVKPTPNFTSAPSSPMNTGGGVVQAPQLGKNTSTPATPAGNPPPKMASPKKSIFKFLPFILIGIGVLSIIGFVIFWFINRSESSEENPSASIQPQVKLVTLQYWGLWEPTTVVNEVISDFESQHDGVSVVYTQQSPQEYRERLQTAIASGEGPDLFRYHASWTPMLRAELAPLPEKVMSNAEYEQTFYPTASEQLTLNGQKVGIPLMIDGLGLYYNKQVLDIANENPPQTWEDVKRLSQLLTIKDGGKITRSGIALGTTANVEHYSDIIGLMMFQNGADPLQPNTEKGQETMSFYNSFAEALQVWDNTLPMSTTAFARGDVVMMIAPSWRVHEIKAQNPNLEFGIVPVPQLADTTKSTWASFWAEGVSSQSTNKEIAWEFLKYLSTSDVQKKLYSDAKKIRAFGEIYSRVDLSSELANEEYVGAYIQDAPYARFSYLNAYTHDNGINDRINKYYLDAINAMNQGRGADEVLVTVAQGILQVLQQYGFQTQAVE